MSELPKDRLTMKEIWHESGLEATLSKEQKQNYRSLSVEKRREIINKYKNKEPFEIPEVEGSNFNAGRLGKTLKKRGLLDLSYETKQSLNNNHVGQFIDDFASRLTSTLANTKNTSTIFTYELINQNFTLIKILDDTLKQNEKLIEQNNEVINLLKQIVNKGDM